MVISFIPRTDPAVTKRKTNSIGWEIRAEAQAISDFKSMYPLRFKQINLKSNVELTIKLGFLYITKNILYYFLLR